MLGFQRGSVPIRIVSRSIISGKGKRLDADLLSPGTRALCRVAESKSYAPAAHAPVAPVGLLTLKRDSRQHDVSTVACLVLRAWQEVLNTDTACPPA